MLTSVPQAVLRPPAKRASAEGRLVSPDCKTRSSPDLFFFLKKKVFSGGTSLSSV